MDARGYVSPEEVRQALKQLYRSDPESNSRTALFEFLSDPLKPADEKGRRKPNPLLLLLFFMLFALIGVFLYFSFGGR